MNCHVAGCGRPGVDHAGLLMPGGEDLVSVWLCRPHRLELMANLHHDFPYLKVDSIVWMPDIKVPVVEPVRRKPRVTY